MRKEKNILCCIHGHCLFTYWLFNFSGEDTSEKGKLYKPTSRLQEDKDSTASKAEEYARLLSDKSKESQRPKKKNVTGEKKKSNLEMFKEELKM